MKSILVIGMGNFGKFLATKLLELKNDVMIIDKNAQIIEELAPIFTNAHIGDCTKEEVLASIGIDSFDICVVAIDENFQSSLEITSLLKEMGAKWVVSKSSRDRQAKFLTNIGADEVIYPEKDVAERLAVRLGASKIFDCIPLTHEYSIFEITVMDDWVGRSIESLNIRKRYNINILAIKKFKTILPSPMPNYTFLSTDHIIIMGHQNDVIKLANKM
ncbi:MAG: TrkA family potassium uptake protein [Bacillota bacterium]